MMNKRFFRQVGLVALGLLALVVVGIVTEDYPPPLVVAIFAGIASAVSFVLLAEFGKNTPERSFLAAFFVLSLIVAGIAAFLTPEGLPAAGVGAVWLAMTAVVWFTMSIPRPGSLRTKHMIR